MTRIMHGTATGHQVRFDGSRPEGKRYQVWERLTSTHQLHSEHATAREARAARWALMQEGVR